MRIGSVKDLNFHHERHAPSPDTVAKMPMGNIKNLHFKEKNETEEGLSISNTGDADFTSLADNMEEFALEIKNTRFEFSIHEDTKRIIVRIYDMNTDELISEIPPEKFLDLIANIWKQVGLIIDKKA
ncbi:MAG: flagellar protein FlaG [Tepidanaerobacteraceae bacterium]|nr:flagellar protein FlaG [Tepidanaerobacteraceae bacterium]